MSIQPDATVGTPFYMAPEMVAKKKYGPGIDVWGLGVVVYELLNLRKPFGGTNRKELYDSILTKQITREEICEADPGLSRLVEMCLDKEDRVSAKAVARNERVRLQLTMLELKYRESRIEALEKRLREYEATGEQKVQDII